MIIDFSVLALLCTAQVSAIIDKSSSRSSSRVTSDMEHRQQALEALQCQAKVSIRRLV
jgi:uncharacterized protein YfcZ (UPF0381/DUF406 family)